MIDLVPDALHRSWAGHGLTTYPDTEPPSSLPEPGEGENSINVGRPSTVSVADRTRIWVDRTHFATARHSHTATAGECVAYQITVACHHSIVAVRQGETHVNPPDVRVRLDRNAHRASPIPGSA